MLSCGMIKTTNQNGSEAKALAIELSDETLSTMQGVNDTLTVAGVSPVFQAHFANAKLDLAGLADLIRDILKENQAEFPRNAHDISELRKIVVSASMFTSDIESEVEKRFTAGSTRYPLQSIKNVLSTYCKDSIGKIQLTNNEDKPRDCCKPRCKWYLIMSK